MNQLPKILGGNELFGTTRRKPKTLLGGEGRFPASRFLATLGITNTRICLRPPPKIKNPKGCLSKAQKRTKNKTRNTSKTSTTEFLRGASPERIGCLSDWVDRWCHRESSSLRPTAWRKRPAKRTGRLGWFGRLVVLVGGISR